jgi:uncharacterized protein YuzB (UPF0349 family)
MLCIRVIQLVPIDDVAEHACLKLSDLPGNRNAVPVVAGEVVEGGEPVEAVLVFA